MIKSIKKIINYRVRSYYLHVNNVQYLFLEKNIRKEQQKVHQEYIRGSPFHGAQFLEQKKAD